MCTGVQIGVLGVAWALIGQWAAGVMGLRGVGGLISYDIGNSGVVGMV